MAFNTCEVFGKLCAPDGSGIAGATVSVYSTKPFYASDGTLIMDYMVSTTTDSNGNWDFPSLVCTDAFGIFPATSVTIAFYYPTGGGSFTRREYTVSIPNSESTTFTDLVPNP